MKPIAYVHNAFESKFGVPRQSGLVADIRSTIVFEPEYRVREALRGIEEWSHLWLIWTFHKAQRESWQPTVRPPVLGGNTRVGVFATRSPFRPNSLGLSCVKLEAVREEPGLGAVLVVSGADMMDGTPIVDIKPYVPYADCHPEASGGFTDTSVKRTVEVDCPETLLTRLPEEQRKGLLGVLHQDPRPAYQDEPGRVYGFPFAGFEIKFTVENGILHVHEIAKEEA